MAVTAVSVKHQCAETTSSALGRGNFCPSCRQASVYLLWCSVFIGVPWPINNDGILLMKRVPQNFCSHSTQNGRGLRTPQAGEILAKRLSVASETVLASLTAIASPVLDRGGSRRPCFQWWDPSVRSRTIAAKPLPLRRLNSQRG